VSRQLIAGDGKHRGGQNRAQAHCVNLRGLIKNNPDVITIPEYRAGRARCPWELDEGREFLCLNPNE
jgi:hypothetical protein